jgi:membrane-associated phospholipid phosphatase
MTSYSADRQSYRGIYFLWLLTGLIGIVSYAWIALAGFEFPLKTSISLVIFIIVTQLMAFIIKALRIRDGDVAVMLLHLLPILITISVLCGFLCYLGNALNLPLVDTQLIEIDHFFHFDWPAYALWLSHYPNLAVLLTFIYKTIIWQLFLLPCVLALGQNVMTIERFVTAYAIAFIITLFLSSLWPSVGTYIFYDVHPDALHLFPAAARLHEHDLLALRGHELKYFPPIMLGLLSFPSFHAVCALLFIWAAWALKYWRWPSLFLNILMIFSVLVDGGHYLTDLAGGLIVALMAIYLTYRLGPLLRCKN